MHQFPGLRGILGGLLRLRRIAVRMAKWNELNQNSPERQPFESLHRDMLIHLGGTPFLEDTFTPALQRGT